MFSSEPQPRPRWRSWAIAAVIVTAVLLLQRQHVAELPSALRLLIAAHPGWIAAGSAASAVTFAMAAWAMIGTVHQRLPFRTAFQVQVATGLTTLAAPAGLGSAGINIWFLQRRGIGRTEAVAAAVRNGVAGGVVHAAGLLLVLWQLPHLIDVDPQLISASVRVAGVVAAALALTTTAAAWRWPAHRRRLLSSLTTSARTTWSLLRRADRALPLVGGSVGLTLTYGIGFWASARAVGIPLDLPTALALELVVAALGGMSATPGGMGVVEAATLQGLLLLGADPAAALAAVLLHRLLTFWLPALPGALALRSLRTSLATDGATARPPVTPGFVRHDRETTPVDLAA